MTATVMPVDANGYALQNDATTHHTVVIDHFDHSVNDGSFFYVCDYTTLGASATADFVVTTPDTTTWAYMTMNIEGANDGVRLEIYEGTTHDGDGSAVTALNSNRNSAATTVLTIQLDPTISNDGTRIYGDQSGQNRRTGTVGRGRALILKQDEDYLFRITSLGAANVVSYCGEWYEHASLD